MSSSLERLLFPAAPRSDESFIGYLLRLVERNDYETLSWILQAAEIKDYAHSSFSFVFNSSLNFLPLSELTGIDESELMPLLYHSVKELRGRMMGDCLVFGSPVPRYIIRPLHPKVCTLCLRESEYTHKIWDLAPVTACPIHECLLLDECPGCQKRISWNRCGVSLCRCKFDWREYKPAMVPSSELEVTKQIYRLCKLPLDIPQAEPAGNIIKQLLNLELQDFLAALFFVASQFAGIMDTKGKHLASKRTNAEFHSVLCRALPVFNNWPENYFSFLDWRRSQQPHKSQNELTGWQKYFAGYKSALFLQLAPSQFDFMRTAFREYVSARRLESYIANAQPSSSSTYPEKLQAKTAKRKSSIEDYMSAQAARNVLKVDWHGINRLIDSGKLKAIIDSTGRNRVLLIERKSVAELKTELDGILFLEQVKKQLGLSSERIRELVKGRMLRSIGDPISGRRSVRNFSRKEVSGLLDGFLNMSLASKHSRSGREIKNGTLSFNNTLRKVERAHISLSTFVRSVLDGAIKPCGECKKAGLQRFLFSETEISEYVRGALQLKTNGALSLAEVSKHLGVTRMAISLLVKKKFLPAQKLPDLETLGQLVTNKSLEHFKANYVLIAKEAKKLKTSSTYIVALLSGQGVHPVSGPEVDGGIVYLFKKTDIAQFNLTSLVTHGKAKRKSLPTKREMTLPPVMSSTQAAEFLEIDRQTVRQLAERGALKPHKRLSRNKQKEGEYYFSSYTVQKYKNRSADHSGLVASMAAVKLFGLWPDNFYNRFVKTGRLKPVIADGRRSDYFFRVEDVEALLEIEKQTIITSEAAEILGVYVSCVDKMITAGILKPISGPAVDGFGKNLFLRNDVEKLRVEREAYKTKRIEEGKTSRFGRGEFRQTSPVRDVIGPRIDQLIEEWQKQTPHKRVTGQRLYQRLISEGYQLGIVTVYIYLRKQCRQAA